MRTEVVGLCESNPVFHKYYKTHAPNATIYDDMRTLHSGLSSGSIPWFHCDAINCTAPCTGRNSLRWHNRRENDTALDKDNDLFLLCVDIVKLLTPSYHSDLSGNFVCSRAGGDVGTRGCLARAELPRARNVLNDLTN